ncbi:protein LTO1 homolog [Paramormyrops kingsleyae]|uniref:LTO1 maturation factor of ABCE1 n=1 Tax=Paramormyrops kingsleyae TaxID=1676925 RepID=A0A3B3QKA1_9TELE|nr:oral cancer-overexpressed protein 1 [Paramormyrops kingsleyae]
MALNSKSEDMFDVILLADDRFHVEGYREGYEEGTRQGLTEGRNHGGTHGAKLSLEMSFYYGFALTWKCLLQNSTEVNTHRKKLKTLETLLALLQSFPYDDAQYENLQQDITKTRAKFRQVCSLLNVLTDFREFVSTAGGLSF